MMKIITTFLCALVFSSCSDSIGMKKSKMVHSKAIDSKENEPISTNEEVSVGSETGFEILLPTNYRDWENKNPVNNLTKDWVDLFEKAGRYYLGKANFTIERGYSECSGDSTQILESKNKTLLFIKSPNLKLGDLNSIQFKKNKIWPGEKVAFNYLDRDYFLRAEGDIHSSEKVISDEGEEWYQNVKNYKLYISTDEISERLFLEEKSFNDSFVELLFVGDIDSDGKLDFIFDASRDYEEKRVVLYLSSEAKPLEIIKKVAEIAVQFDC